MAVTREATEGAIRGVTETGTRVISEGGYNLLTATSQQIFGAFEGILSTEGVIDDAKGALILSHYKEKHPENHQALTRLLNLLSKKERDDIILVFVYIIALSKTRPSGEVEETKPDAKKNKKKTKPDAKQETSIQYLEQLKVTQIDWDNPKSFTKLFGIINDLVAEFNKRSQEGEFNYQQAVKLLTDLNLYGDPTLGKKIAGALAAWKRGKGQDSQFFEKLGDWLRKVDAKLTEPVETVQQFAETSQQEAEDAWAERNLRKTERAEERARRQKLKKRDCIRAQEGRKS